jgi:hypothetical protein
MSDYPDVYTRMHKAVSTHEPQQCDICGQRVKRVLGGHGRVWIHADTSAVLALNPPTPPEPFRCEAVLRTGPGHQSKLWCTRTDAHPLDGEHYVMQAVHEWTGPEGFEEYRG